MNIAAAAEAHTPPSSTQHPASSILRRRWPWLAAALTGALLALCLPPWNQGWLCWFALTPLICAVWFSHGSSRRAALLGYVAGIVFVTAAFSWLSSLGTLFAQPLLYGLPFLLALYLGLYLAFWAWFIRALVRGHALVRGQSVNLVVRPRPHCGRFSRQQDSRTDPSAFLSSRRNLLTAFLGACAWVAHEWVRGWLFSGFGWNNLGVSLHADLAMIQIADLTGVAGLSFLVAFVNLMAVLVVRRILAELGPGFLKRIRWEFSFTAALVVLVFSYGVRSLLQKSAGPVEMLRVAALQPNIPQTQKFSAAAEDEIFAQLRHDTGLAALLQPELLIWPEAALPRGMFADQTNYDFVMEQAARGDFGLLIGTVETEAALEAASAAARSPFREFFRRAFLWPPEDGEAGAARGFNTAALLTDRGANIQAHRKMHLVPFGEYMPLRRSFPLFAKVAGDLVASDFSAGEKFTVMELPKPAIRLAALICFEDTLGDLTRRFVQKGAQLLVNITNDGWFLHTAAAEQHLANAVFRAVENRRPLIRCANTGVTCAIDPDGRVQRWMPKFERNFVTRTVLIPRDPPLTFYTRHGEWFDHAAALVVALTLIVFWRRRRTT